ncbi:MAG: sugar ABC transporter permease, partial [Chloroflexota bacterium]
MADRTPPRPASSPEPAPDPGAAESPRLSIHRLTAGDQRSLVIGVGIIVALELLLVWLPALASVVLSFTKWDGVGPIEIGDFVGLRNYELLLTTYPRFWSALLNNALWLLALLCIAVPAGLGLAVVLDRGIRGGRFYQGALYLPVLLSLALIGFIWELQLSPGEGLLNGVLGRTAPDAQIDWLGNRSINRFVVLVPAIWRHV